jgi:hypothetical protein
LGAAALIGQLGQKCLEKETKKRAKTENLEAHRVKTEAWAQYYHAGGGGEVK